MQQNDPSTKLTADTPDNVQAGDNPTISIIVPAYNQGFYLPQTLDSILAQTYRDYEIIVVDDGSTDNSADVVRQTDYPIHYIYQENQGLAGARNTGMGAARGTYLTFLDSDDCWLPTFLEKMVALAQRKPEATVYYCGWQMIDADGQILPQAPNKRVIPEDEANAMLLRRNFVNCSSAIMRREAVLAAGCFDIDFRRLQDWEFWLRLALAGHSFVGIPDCLSQYRQHGSSLSTDPTGGQRAAMALAVKHFGPDDEQWTDWSAAKRRMFGGVYSYFALTTSLIRAGDWNACARHLRRALLIDPSLVEHMDMWYELALGQQPIGRRGTVEGLDLAANERHIMTLLATIFDEAEPSLKALQKAATQAAYAALATVAYNVGHYALSQRVSGRALRTHFLSARRSPLLQLWARAGYKRLR